MQIRLPSAIAFMFTQTLVVGCFSSKNHHFSAGKKWLETSTEQSNVARQKILEANKLRKSIAQSHKKKVRSKDSIELAKILANIEQEAAKMRLLQKEGAKLRNLGIESKSNSIRFFKKGFMTNWSQWAKQVAPMKLAKNGEAFISHNPKYVSLDPKEIARQGLISTLERRGNIELVTILRSQDAPENLDLSSVKISRHRKLIGHIEVFRDERWGYEIPLNQIHSWVLAVSDLSGEPVNDTFKVAGHMPGHVHGLPTQPHITKQLAPGIYLIEGIKFQMRGWWVMLFETKKDSIRFNVVL
ncbi:MAG: hypothetical protein AB8G05_27710 [Oligoflexales bacterium]